MDDEPDINELLRMESELEGDASSMREPSLERDAKVNLLKFLQIRTVKKYEEAYDDLYYELSMGEGLGCLRRIEELDPKSNLIQPKVLEQQGFDADKASRSN